MPIETKFSRGVLLDTHIWVQLQSGLSALSPAAFRAVEAATFRRAVYVPLISVWEIAMLARKKRLEFEVPVRDWVAEALDKPAIQLLPFTIEIAIEAAGLPEPMHKDPADRIIVASALVENLPLVTSDRMILALADRIGVRCIEG